MDRSASEGGTNTFRARRSSTARARSCVETQASAPSSLNQLRADVRLPGIFAGRAGSSAQAEDRDPKRLAHAARTKSGKTAARLRTTEILSRTSTKCERARNRRFRRELRLQALSCVSPGFAKSIAFTRLVALWATRISERWRRRPRGARRGAQRRGWRSTCSSRVRRER